VIELSPHTQGAMLPVRAQPGARKSAILGERDGALRVAVNAVPEKGKANAALAQFLALSLGLKVSQVRLISGAAARDKRYLIIGLSPDDLRARLGRWLEPSLLDSPQADRATSTPGPHGHRDNGR
jgi:hypothetical protein